MLDDRAEGTPTLLDAELGDLRAGATIPGRLLMPDVRGVLWRRFPVCASSASLLGLR
jgi:hypothetical protein